MYKLFYVYFSIEHSADSLKLFTVLIEETKAFLDSVIVNTFSYKFVFFLNMFLVPKSSNISCACYIGSVCSLPWNYKNGRIQIK